MDEKKVKTTPTEAKCYSERIAQALAAAGLEMVDCRKLSAVDGDLYTVRVLDKRV